MEAHQKDLLAQAGASHAAFAAKRVAEPINSLSVQEIQDEVPDMLAKLSLTVGKQSFLVFKNNKYFTVPTKSIAFFYLRYDCTIITCFDGQEYTVDHSLEQIQNLLSQQFFFRLNRQYLINFYAVKEAEHYFGRKLFVRLSIATQEKLIVSKEKVRCFFHWLDNR